MANLAIKGRQARGDEVIEILKMLGGKNDSKYNGETEMFCYYIDENGRIECDTDDEIPIPCTIFTIEEFIEKFPYKVGDKAITFGNKYTIIDAVWNKGINEVIYIIKLDACGYTTTKLSNQLKIYKEETMEKEISGAIIDRFICLEGYDFYDDKGNIIDTKEITMKKKQPKYPKTFVECAKILDCFCAAHIDGYYCRLLEDLQALLICRDAYWKIAGEQMGLGKSWEPDWLNVEQDKYVLFTHNNAICSNRYVLGHNILAFPTKEMRDAFYENFKELIEVCKELL